MKNIAILCSGGDASGMNPALKHFVEYAIKNNLTPYFIYDGYEGLIDGDIQKATYHHVAGIINKGGTIIRSSRSKRFLEKKYREIAYNHLKKHNIDKLIVLGGDGSMRGLDIFAKEFDIKCSAIPATIDNDINYTEYTLGVDTALNIIKGAIDAIRDTASSFQRAFVIETMGRNCGYLALITHLTSGSEMCLIPEKSYNLDDFKENFQQQKQNGRKYFIAIVSEGIAQDPQEIANWFEKNIEMKARVTILGHIQRGGNPTVYDRLMAHKFVHHSINSLLENQSGNVVCFTKNGFKNIPLAQVVQGKKQLDAELLALM
ncbi:6-phosphofructokinase [hydrothermal vent metagenome]|uniref:6-phosphofructokinase n=1 Tax=hydrothermal vent metagenome TaxID=652676 RepID=A0A1W1D300_9ZZZZ